ncbi:TetR family transcriptional regulator [Pseudonocardia ailaonensis]|uniref:TetR family transcriptional regulator n=1 Tax=Pseudonocardia ailaonensis TaxID=367279 RepID=A0ABN2NG00_9PSEU
MGYDNSGRAAAAKANRTRVLAAARAAFLESGWAGTTIRGVAEGAGVSQETVYKTFGNKAALLKAVHDVAMAGDDEPVSVADRPAAQRVRAATTPEEGAAAYAAMAREISERAGPLMRVMLASRGGDADLEAYAATLDEQRLVGTTIHLGHWAERGWLRTDATRARDIVWMLISPAVHEMTVARGWSGDDYEAWLAETLRATILTDS